MAVAVYFSCMTNSQKMESSPPPRASSVKALFPTFFLTNKVFLGCEFTAFECAAQRPRTVSAGWVPWKGK